MDVHEFIEGLTEDHLQCRELGHLWRPFRASLSAERTSYERVLRCHRCKTQRVQELSLSGALVSNRYVYPDGYTSHGLGRMAGTDRDELRMTSMHRFMDRKGVDHA